MIASAASNQSEASHRQPANMLFRRRRIARFTNLFLEGALVCSEVMGTTVSVALLEIERAVEIRTVASSSCVVSRNSRRPACHFKTRRLRQMAIPRIKSIAAWVSGVRGADRGIDENLDDKYDKRDYNYVDDVAARNVIRSSKRHPGASRDEGRETS